MSALADTLVSQLVDLMPELEGLSAWPQYGQRRGAEEAGRVAERPMRVELRGDQIRDAKTLHHKLDILGTDIEPFVIFQIRSIANSNQFSILIH